MNQLGAGKEQLKHFSGIPEKSLRKGQFAKMRAGIRGACKR